jgi:Na+-transporting methylmalonyl-CoA/oxaloacetate decarboxylase gamma subunit
MIGKIVKFFVMGIAALIAIGLGLAALGLAFGLAVLALKIGVVVAIGYGVVKLVGGGKKTPREPQISEADRRWLES